LGLQWTLFDGGAAASEVEKAEIVRAGIAESTGESERADTAGGGLGRNKFELG
jgi:hypothetical protein